MSLKEPQKSTCILLVDDEEIICEMLSFYLEKHGFITLQATTIPQALLIAGSHVVDLVISDLNLPKGSGLDLAAQIKTSDGIRPPIIIMSGNISEITHEQIKTSGVLALLEKPIDFEFLMGEVHRILALSSQFNG